MNSQKIICKLCKLECKSNMGLIRHYRCAHNMTKEDVKRDYEELYPKKEITGDMIECKICNEYCKPLGMPSHLRRKHSISVKDYYDTYIKQENDGKCKTCGKETSFRGIVEGYSKYCSSKCANLDPEVQEKMKQNSLKKFGVEHPLQSKEVKEKVKQTNIEKYGVDSYMKTEAFRKKAIESIKSEEVIEKRKQTNLERYGVELPFQSKDIQEKIKQTNVKKYGAENIFASEYGKNKIKETNLERYGCINGGASKQAQEKIKKTKNRKIEQFCKENNCIPLTEVDVDYSVKDSIFHNKLLLYNDRYFVRIEDIDEIVNHTPKNYNQSVIENDIFDFVRSIYLGTIIRNTRNIIKPKELDIYLPELNLAIEVDGIFFHSTNNYTPKDYHLNKTLACNSIGIRLIHITDWEWTNKLDICKSIIRSAINKYDTRIYARDCNVKEVSQNESDNFLYTNHLQGKVKATYRLGLYYNDELVQLICIGKSRYKKDEIELLRMCTKLNTQVTGGFSKLMAHQPYNKIISYLDRSKFTGNSYKSVGFDLLSTSGPSFKYYKNNIELSRIATQKHKLKDLLKDNYDSSLSESQNMIANGWLQVYDCGTIKMEYHKT